jgi:hypothetical protein
VDADADARNRRSICSTDPEREGGVRAGGGGGSTATANCRRRPKSDHQAGRCREAAAPGGPDYK